MWIWGKGRGGGSGTATRRLPIWGMRGSAPRRRRRWPGSRRRRRRDRRRREGRERDGESMRRERDGEREEREREVVCLTRLSWWGVSVWRAGPGGAGGYVGDIIGTRAFPHCHVGPTRKLEIVLLLRRIRQNRVTDRWGGGSCGSHLSVRCEGVEGGVNVGVAARRWRLTRCAGGFGVWGRVIWGVRGRM